jgi:predicted adenylyl cyclase CyaB
MMPTNIEIKARTRDFGALRKRVEQLSDSPAQTILQTDTFFLIARGRLKLRELGAGAAQLIYYERPDQDGPKRSDYHLFETADPAQLKSVLSQALGVRGTVRKVRTLYLVGQTRVHLDEVEHLGHFLELEVVLGPDQTEQQGQAIATELISDLGLDTRDLLQGAYIDLLEENQHGAS